MRLLSYYSKHGDFKISLSFQHVKLYSVQEKESIDNQTQFVLI